MSNTSTKSMPHSPDSWSDTFRISPLICIPLNSLYGSLVVPLPLLAYQTHAPIPPTLLIVGIAIGWVALNGALSERVHVNDQGMCVAYAPWVPSVWRKGWSLPWAEVIALKPRSTGQGGLVYYFVSKTGDAYLLPMRIAGFARFVRYVEQQTGIDTTDVRSLSQPWMYLILFVATIFLWLVDGWAAAMVMGGIG